MLKHNVRFGGPHKFSMCSLGNKGLTQLSCSSVSQVSTRLENTTPPTTHLIFNCSLFFYKLFIEKILWYNGKIGKKTMPYSIIDLKELHVHWGKQTYWNKKLGTRKGS